MRNYVVQEHITRQTRIITRDGEPMTREDAQALRAHLDATNTDAARSYTVGYATITRAMVDYLPVAVRAAHHCPGSSRLWVESFLAQQAIIMTANRLMPEADAAEAQALTGRIAHWATRPASADTVAASQRAKSALLHLVSLART
jgi:hypothetical protein